ncbi:hypothetical protein F5J12DRAFT_936607 [Pisolithus orientalis]|uniref:uncharacterized protein n=1 Tax=Pisolithus orientalis TaxID=936130 RepID=UPI0022251B6E|nr:uncharacterized protein F5J12DRAFT_936607 [Pisolithus orientalis]KAI6008119.1 hypothetical protein F5J12DRAFT_936607 [Pisolithus orientalis]
MGQHALEAILREHLAKLDEKCVRVKVAKHRGDDGEEVEEDIEVAYLIGADGAKSVTRKQLGLTFLGTTREDDFLVGGDIRLEVKGLDRDHWHWFGTVSQDVGTTDLKGLARDEEALVSYIKDFIGLGDDVEVKEVIPNIRLVNKFGVGRIFICGDAAHAHSPAGGQGLNSSVRDALNIAWKIALVYKGLSPASLLDTYTIERLPVITEMLVSSVPHDQLLAKVKPNLEHSMRRGEKMYMLGVNYRSSPIVIDDFAPTPTSGAEATYSAYGDTQEGVLLAGDRAPDAPGLVPVISLNRASCSISSGSQSNGMAWSTHQSVRKEFVRRVIILPGPPSELDGRVEMPSGDDQAIDAEVLVDQAGHAHRGYVVEKQAIKVVVRPDGVVGAIVRGATGLEQYFEGVFGKTEGMRAK